MTHVYAHRGASIELPENTLAAFSKAMEYGVHGIELDVHLSRDGEAVVIHDESVDRTTNGSGQVSELTLAEMQSLDAGDGESIPTLAQVLALVSGRLHVDIEVKAAAAADQVLAEVARHKDLTFAISSFNHDVLRHVRRVDASVELWPLVGAISDEAIATALELGSPQLAVFDGMVNPDIMAYARSKGLGLWVWTVNDPARAAELVELGAVGICTDDPKTIRDVVKASAPS